MSRTLTEIYNLAKETRDKYLELTEFHNSSKMSVLDSFTWVTSTCIWAFENILDVFKIDLAKDLQNRINGTPQYYANALLKYQAGSELIMNEEGTQFQYAEVDETKRIITKVSYHEETEVGFHDTKLIMKVATGNAGAYEAITGTDLLAIQSYINKISFAGTHIAITSRNGDVLIPRLTVFYDGSLTPEEILDSVTESLNEYIASIGFDSEVYVQQIINAIKETEHVVDVYINPSNNQQGIFVAQYNSSNELIPTEFDENENPISHIRKIDRYFVPNSGFVKQSTGTGAESSLEKWAQSIILVVVGMPVVDTNNISAITANSASCGGTVVEDGGHNVTARGICWSTSENPTVSNYHTTNGTGTGLFTGSMTSLVANTQYYVRAYATNSKGTNYGEQKVFTTLSE